MNSVTSPSSRRRAKREPLVSVLMPCRNAEATVEEAIDSVLGQTMADFELLIWNDGSDDATAAILDRACQTDPRVVIVGNQRAGLVPALQRLAAHARGRYLARMDADDRSRPERLARQLDAFDTNPRLGLCGCLHETIGDAIGSGRRRYDDWINALVSHDDIAREAFVECPVAHPTFMLRREAFEAAGGYSDNPWPEDYDLFMRTLRCGWQIAKVPETLFDWRDYPARTSLVDERYSGAQFRAVKRHYLVEIHPRVAEGFYQWGAGDVGKRWLREWEGAHRPHAVVDIDPRKIGQSIHGFEVIGPDALPAPGETFVVVAVGAPGAREDIREWFARKGYVETRDYIFLA